ncbi:MAG: hypothetical protein WCA49_08015 [Candidatus Sulfotelmatobacter sp.]
MVMDETEAVLTERSEDGASVAEIAAPDSEPSGARLTAVGADLVDETSPTNRESFAADVALSFTVLASAERKIGAASVADVDSSEAGAG